MIFKDKPEDMDVSVWASEEASFSLPILYEVLHRVSDLRGMSMGSTVSTWPGPPVRRWEWRTGWQSSQRAWTRVHGASRAFSCAQAASSPHQTTCPTQHCPSRWTENKKNTNIKFYHINVWDKCFCVQEKFEKLTLPDAFSDHFLRKGGGRRNAAPPSDRIC